VGTTGKIIDDFEEVIGVLGQASGELIDQGFVPFAVFIALDGTAKKYNAKTMDEVKDDNLLHDGQILFIIGRTIDERDLHAILEVNSDGTITVAERDFLGDDDTRFEYVAGSNLGSILMSRALDVVFYVATKKLVKLSEMAVKGEKPENEEQAQLFKRIERALGSISGEYPGMSNEQILDLLVSRPADESN
jgi:hypothetical protein